MTYQVACSTCGCTLYAGFNLRNPADVLKPLGFRCKKCGVELSKDHFKVNVWRSEDVITSASGYPKAVELPERQIVVTAAVRVAT